MLAKVPKDSSQMVRRVAAEIEPVVPAWASVAQAFKLKSRQSSADSLAQTISAQGKKMD
jgi:hypothetical protein